MAREQKPLPFQIYVGDVPAEDLTEEEWKAFQERTAERMGQALNDCFSGDIETYRKIKDT